MKNKTLLVALGLALAIGLTGCTENMRTKSFGGTTTVRLPCDSKLVVVTWKDSNLWYATRPMRPDETSEVTTFKEVSTLGMMEGTVFLEESACP